MCYSSTAIRSQWTTRFIRSTYQTRNWKASKIWCLLRSINLLHKITSICEELALGRVHPAQFECQPVAIVSPREWWLRDISPYGTTCKFELIWGILGTWWTKTCQVKIGPQMNEILNTFSRTEPSIEVRFTLKMTEDWILSSQVGQAASIASPTTSKNTACQSQISALSRDLNRVQSTSRLILVGSLRLQTRRVKALLTCWDKSIQRGTAGWAFWRMRVQLVNSRRGSRVL